MAQTSAFDDTQVPHREVCLQRPERHRTIYVYEAIADHQNWLPATPVPNVGIMDRHFAGHSHIAEDWPLEPLPPEVMLKRPADMSACPAELFADFRFDHPVDFPLQSECLEQT